MPSRPLIPWCVLAIGVLVAAYLGLVVVPRQAVAAAREESIKELAGLQRSLQSLADKLDRLESAHAQTNAFLQHAVGKDIPVKLPDQVVNQLDSFEGKVGDRSTWPTSYKEAEQLQQELGILIGKLPPWTEQMILPRLVPLRWATSALLLALAPVPASSESLGRRKEDIEDLLENAPHSATSDLKSALVKCLEDCSKRLSATKREEAIAEAKKAIAKHRGDEAVLSAAWSKLRALGTGDREIAQLCEDLRLLVRDASFGTRLGSVETTYNRIAEALKEDRVRQGGLARVHDAASGLLLDLEVESPRPVALIDHVHRLLRRCEAEQLQVSKRQQEAVAKSLRDYQKWALQQILKFDGPDGWDYKTTLPWVGGQLKGFNKATEDMDWVGLHGQRVSNSFQDEDFCQELGVHHAAEHLAP